MVAVSGSPGFLARISSCEVLKWAASDTSVSLDWLVYVYTWPTPNGSRVGRGVPTYLGATTCVGPGRGVVDSAGASRGGTCAAGKQAAASSARATTNPTHRHLFTARSLYSLSHPHARPCLPTSDSRSSLLLASRAYCLLLHASRIDSRPSSSISFPASSFQRPPVHHLRPLTALP